MWGLGAVPLNDLTGSNQIYANTEFTLLLRVTQSLPPRNSHSEVLSSHTTRIYSFFLFNNRSLKHREKVKIYL